MRILFVNPYYKPYLGGVERVIERLTAELRRCRGVEATGVLTTNVYFPDRIMHGLPAHEVIDGVEVFRCTFRPSSLPNIFHAALAGYVCLEIPRVIREFKPDVIHYTYSEWWGANLNTYLASRRLPHVLSTFFHELPSAISTRPLFAVNRWLVPRMDAVHVVSDLERQQVHRVYGAPLERTVMILPGVDMPNHTPNRVARGSVTILAVGRLSAHKGQLQLVKMVQSLVMQEPDTNIRLLLAGDDAGAGEPIAEYVTRHGLDAVVQVMGRCSDEELQTLYQQADIFALPTQYESFGLVYIEAMSHGLPVVTYGVGPLPSILTKGAVLVPTGDEAGFREALRGLIHEPHRRLQLGLAGHEFVRQRFSWRATAQQFFDLYAEIRSRRRRACLL